MFDVKPFALCKKLAALPGLRHPGSSSAGHGVELQQQLAHHRHNGHIAWLPALPQTVRGCLKRRKLACGHEGEERAGCRNLGA